MLYKFIDFGVIKLVFKEKNKFYFAGSATFACKPKLKCVLFRK